MNWKTNLLLILLMILIIHAISAESNGNQTIELMMNTENEKNKNNEITWSDSEVQELIEEMKRIKNEAIDEAVKKAVIPLIADIEIMRLKIEERDNRILVLANEITGIKSQHTSHLILTCAGGMALGFLIGYFIFGFGGK